MNIIDITKGIFTAKIYPGDPEPELIRVCEREKNDDRLSNILSCCLPPNVV